MVDDCTLAVAVKFGNRVGSFGCAAAQKLQESSPKTTYRYS